MGALADIGQIDAAAFHSCDLGGAVCELPQLDGDTLFLKGAGVHGGQDAPQGSVVGHVGDAQSDGLDALAVGFRLSGFAGVAGIVGFCRLVGVITVVGG